MSYNFADIYDPAARGGISPGLGMPAPMDWLSLLNGLYRPSLAGGLLAPPGGMPGNPFNISATPHQPAPPMLPGGVLAPPPPMGGVPMPPMMPMPSGTGMGGGDSRGFGAAAPRDRLGQGAGGRSVGSGSISGRDALGGRSIGVGYR